MRRVLILKLSSMGDIIHTFPALTDARLAQQDIVFDWVVEPGFAEIPRWHPAVDNVIEAPLRQFRRAPWQFLRQGQAFLLFKKLRKTHYDLVIDAQGLIKSALLAQLTRGKKSGLDWHSAREPLASCVYDHKISVPVLQHAVERTRQLFAQALNYPVPSTMADYGIQKNHFQCSQEKHIIFFHGTTWVTKHWPQPYWCELARLVIEAGYRILLPWGNEIERKRAEVIKAFVQKMGLGNSPEILPKLGLTQVSALISSAQAIVTVDTGLGHIAAALGIPTIAIYGPTHPGRTGTYGKAQVHLQVTADCAPCFGRKCKKGTHFDISPPCFKSLGPEKIFQAMITSIKAAKNHGLERDKNDDYSKNAS